MLGCDFELFTTFSKQSVQSVSVLTAWRIIPQAHRAVWPSIGLLALLWLNIAGEYGAIGSASSSETLSDLSYKRT